MDEKLKAKWVKALRSGKYRQAHESLRAELYDDDDNDMGLAYCCLGVLCEITPGIKWNEDEGHYAITSKKLTKLFTSEEADNWLKTTDQTVLITAEDLPAPLYKHFGMDKLVKHNKETKNVHAKLIGMNDGGKNFKQIADYIEKVL